MTTLPYPYSSSAHFYTLRLLPGREVFSQLYILARQYQLHAAWIAGCTGSLTDITLRYAGQEGTTLLNGTFGVISLDGMLKQSGEHLHLYVSDLHDTMLSDHMISGYTVRITLKLVIGSLEELVFSHQSCALSGYDGLYIFPIKQLLPKRFSCGA